MREQESKQQSQQEGSSPTLRVDTNTYLGTCSKFSICDQLLQLGIEYAGAEKGMGSCFLGADLPRDTRENAPSRKAMSLDIPTALEFSLPSQLMNMPVTCYQQPTGELLSSSIQEHSEQELSEGRGTLHSEWLLELSSTGSESRISTQQQQLSRPLTHSKVMQGTAFPPPRLTKPVASFSVALNGDGHVLTTYLDSSAHCSRSVSRISPLWISGPTLHLSLLATPCSSLSFTPVTQTLEKVLSYRSLKESGLLPSALPSSFLTRRLPLLDASFHSQDCWSSNSQVSRVGKEDKRKIMSTVFFPKVIEMDLDQNGEIQQERNTIVAKSICKKFISALRASQHSSEPVLSLQHCKRQCIQPVDQTERKLDADNSLLQLEAFPLSTELKSKDPAPVPPSDVVVEMNMESCRESCDALSTPLTIKLRYDELSEFPEGYEGCEAALVPDFSVLPSMNQPYERNMERRSTTTRESGGSRDLVTEGRERETEMIVEDASTQTTTTNNKQLNLGCEASFTKAETTSVLRHLQANSTTKLLATSLEGMYGENKVSNLLFLCQTLQRYFFMDRSSIFLDIGSGRGLPNSVAAITTNVKASIGIEIDLIAYNLSLRNQIDLYSILLPARIQKDLDIFDAPGDCRLSFKCLDGVLLDTFDPVTHVFSFDLAMPVFMIERFITLFNESFTAFVFVTFRRDLSEFRIDAEPVCQVPMEMAVSGEKHRATVYVKRSHLHRLAESIPHVDLMFTPSSEKPNPLAEELDPFAPVVSENESLTISSVETNLDLRCPMRRMTTSPIGHTDMSTPSSGHVQIELASLLSSAERHSALRCSVCSGWTRLPYLNYETENGNQLDRQHLMALRNRKNGKKQCAITENVMDKKTCDNREPRSSWKSRKKKRPTCPYSKRYDHRSDGIWSSDDKLSTSILCPPTVWVQCDICTAWRSLPGCTPEEKDELEQQKFWCCTMNRWDKKHAYCGASPDPNDLQEIPIEVTRWAQCAECQKWRALPGCTALEYKGIQRKEAWVCSMNVWDLARASCDITEEFQDSHLPIGTTFQKKDFDSYRHEQQLNESSLSSISTLSTPKCLMKVPSPTHRSEEGIKANTSIDFTIATTDSLQPGIRENHQELPIPSLLQEKIPTISQDSVPDDSSGLNLLMEPIPDGTHEGNETGCSLPIVHSSVAKLQSVVLSTILSDDRSHNSLSNSTTKLDPTVNQDGKKNIPSIGSITSASCARISSHACSFHPLQQRGQTIASSESSVNDDDIRAITKEKNSITAQSSDFRVAEESRCGSELQIAQEVLYQVDSKEKQKQDSVCTSLNPEIDTTGVESPDLLFPEWLEVEVNPLLTYPVKDGTTADAPTDCKQEIVETMVQKGPAVAEILNCDYTMNAKFPTESFLKQGDICSTQAEIKRIRESSIFDKGSSSLVSVEQDHKRLLFLPPILISKCWPYLSTRLMRENKSVVPCHPSSLRTFEDRNLSQRLLVLCCERIKEFESIISSIIALKKEGKSDSKGKCRENTCPKPLGLYPERLEEYNDMMHRSDTNSDHLQRLSERCQLSLVQQAEWAYLELSAWLTSSVSSRQKRKNSKYEKSFSPKKSCQRLTNSTKGRKRLSHGVTGALMSEHDVKKQRHQEMEDALDNRWEKELECKEELVARGLWCTCGKGGKQTLVKPVLLAPGQNLVCVGPMNLSCTIGAVEIDKTHQNNKEFQALIKTIEMEKKQWKQDQQKEEAGRAMKLKECAQKRKVQRFQYELNALPMETPKPKKRGRKAIECNSFNEYPKSNNIVANRTTTELEFVPRILRQKRPKKTRILTESIINQDGKETHPSNEVLMHPRPQETPVIQPCVLHKTTEIWPQLTTPCKYEESPSEQKEQEKLENDEIVQGAEDQEYNSERKTRQQIISKRTTPKNITQFVQQESQTELIQHNPLKNGVKNLQVEVRDKIENQQEQKCCKEQYFVEQNPEWFETEHKSKIELVGAYSIDCSDGVPDVSQNESTQSVPNIAAETLPSTFMKPQKSVGYRHRLRNETADERRRRLDDCALAWLLSAENRSLRSRSRQKQEAFMVSVQPELQTAQNSLRKRYLPNCGLISANYARKPSGRIHSYRSDSPDKSREYRTTKRKKLN